MKPCKRCGEMVLGIPDKSRGISCMDRSFDSNKMEKTGWLPMFPFIEHPSDLCDTCRGPEKQPIGKDSNAGLWI